MKKDNAIAYIAVSPILPAVWGYVSFILPMAHALFAGSSQDMMNHTPRLTQLVYHMSHTPFISPVLWVFGITITMGLVILARNVRTRAFFPIALSISWAVIFSFSLFSFVGMLLPLMPLLKPFE